MLLPKWDHVPLNKTPVRECGDRPTDFWRPTVPQNPTYLATDRLPSCSRSFCLGESKGKVVAVAASVKTRVAVAWLQG